jgi:chitin synthase
MYADMEEGEKCYLEERICVIKEEIENARRQGKYSGVENNDNFPETIPKRISLLYQNKWKPGKGAGRERLNLLTCFKHLNGKKLSSHAWFFEGFCRYLKP